MSWKRALGTVLFFSLLPLLCNGQGADTLSFHHIDIRLTQSTVATITQDKDGFMWFGTRYGLNKYGGAHVQSFINIEGDTTTLSDSRINDVALDKNGNFWLATNAGLNHYDLEENIFTRFFHNPADANSLSADLVLATDVDRFGRIWVGTESAGLNIYDPKNGRFYRYRKNARDPFSISSNAITKIIEDDRGEIWIGTRGGGLNLFDPNTNRFIRYDISDQEANNTVTALHSAGDQLWVGTKQGLFVMSYEDGGHYKLSRFASDTKKYDQIISRSPILSLLQDENKNLWIGTENNGLLLVDPERKQVSSFRKGIRKDQGPSGNSIWSLFQDDQGIIWIGTYDNGLDKLDPLEKKIPYYSSAKSGIGEVNFNVVSSFAEIEGEGLWIASDGGGLNFWDYQSEELTTYRASQAEDALMGDAVLSILVDSQGDLWASSWQGGVSIKRKGSEGFEHVGYSPGSEMTLLGVDAFFVFEDSRENIWISLFHHGINIYDKSNGTLKSIVQDESPTSLSNAKIKCIIEPRPGEFWLATEGDGIDRIWVDKDYNILRKENFRFNTGDTTGINHNMVNHLHVAQSGKLWITTFGGGVNLMDTTTKYVQRIQEEDGLSSNIVFSLEEDQAGNIWVGTSYGLCRISPELEVEQFTAFNGLEEVEFTKSASFINESGELFFGTKNGYYRFHPDDILKNTRTPEVELTGFNLNDGRDDIKRNQQLLKYRFPGNEIILKHNQNDFSFSFSVLNYSQPMENNYAYKLQGYDDEWISSNDGLDIRYTNVPPGRYRFMAKGSNNDGVWNTKGSSITVIIKPPWYLTGYSFFGYLMVFLVLLWFFRQAIVYRERLKNELQMEHLELTKMQELDRLKSQFFANISHEFRTPLTLIIGPLRAMLSGTYIGDFKNQFRVMSRNAERLLQLINQILDLSKIESGAVQLKATEGDIVKFLKPLYQAFSNYAQKQYIDYKCHFPDHGVNIYFEEDKIEKVVVNLLSNAFKHTPEFGKISFEVKETEDSVCFSVTDTGSGIPKDELDKIFDRFYQVNFNNGKGSGIGLALTKELVELHKGSIMVESQVNGGSCFSVRLLKGTSHLKFDEIYQSEIVVDRGFEEDFKQIDLAKNDLSLNPVEAPTTEKENDAATILLVDDNDDVRSFISDYLGSSYKILEAKDGQEGLSLTNEHIPDVVIADIIMPEMDGYDLCRKIKTEERTSHIPVILLTAKASGDSTEEGFKHGADYYLIKPFNPKILELRIKNILRARNRVRNRLLNGDVVEIQPKEIKALSKDQAFLKNAISILEENISDSNFGVEELCHEVGLSRTQLYRKLKTLAGQSANEFIRSFRLKRAAQLLSTGGMTISEVTYQVGFNDLQYFRDCFKKQFGSNPSEYVQSANKIL